jgi:O-antigen ligase/tetratricopeptide (TPR) repeat protein
MTRRVALCLAAIVVLANGSATCLYSGAGPVVDTPLKAQAPWNPVLKGVAELLTLPIQTPEIVDVRDVVLPLALGAALLVVVVGSRLRLAAGTGREKHGPNGGQRAPASRNPAESWLVLAAGGVTVLACFSTLRNQSFYLSCGWMVRFVAGAVWALLLARTFSPRLAKQTTVALVVLALLTSALTIAHRADLGLAHFTWPIGPITITGALAAVWAACSGGLAIGQLRSRRALGSTAFCGMVCAIAVYVLQQTGRRAPALGLAAAAVVVIAILSYLRSRGRRDAVVIGALFVLAAAGAALYVFQQAGSPRREAAGPLILRFGYWRLSADLIAKRPVLGYGPDTFVIHMTNAVAPLRAYRAHVYHGNLDPYAHSEWIQAAVELGLPAAALYVAMPIGVICLAVRRLGRAARLGLERSAAQGGEGQGRPPDRAAVLALVAGLVAIIVLDSASITLRSPIMPLWYWTFIGLLAALCREGGTPSAVVSPIARIGRPVGSIVLVALAMAFLVVSAVEIERATGETRRIVRPRSHQAMRLFAERSILSQHENAVRASVAAHAQPSKPRIEVALSLWRELYEEIPGFQDVPARYADILVLASRRDEAQRVLEDALSERLNPFNVAANMLYAKFITNDPVVQFRCVQRALRFGPLGGTPEGILVDVLRQPAAVQALEQDLPTARQIASNPPDESAAGPTVELLRIAAFAEQQVGSVAAAVADQRLAAEFYRRLEREQNPYRRFSGAEADAFFALARMLYDADHADYQEAYQAVAAAEGYAVLGIQHEAVANPKPEEGFLGGEVIPTEFPESLYPLWQLSSLLHVLAGHEQHLIERIYSGLPAHRWTDADVRQELARIYGQAYRDLSAISPKNRPPYYEHVRGLAQQLGATPQPESSPGL